MLIRLNKDKFNNIENAFKVLKESPTNKAACEIISKNLEDMFGCEFDIRVIQNEQINGIPAPLFVMSVYPETSVMDKIINSVLSNSDTGVIQKLWETNKKWIIEIDSKMLMSNIIDCDEKELTAILLHEIGHISCSNSIPNRISLILRYEVAKANITNKMLLKDKIFKQILSLPILDACVGDGKKTSSSIREEVKADAFAKKMGYQKELISVLNKLMNNSHYKSKSTDNEKMKEISEFSMKTLDDFQQRKDALAKKSLLTLKEGCASPYLSNVIGEFVDTVFEDSTTSLSVINGRKLEYMHERADNVIQDGYFTEFFVNKQLKRIEPYEYDYMLGKIMEMQNDTDRMMIVTYIYNKIDMVNYYISIIKDPVMSKKYVVPHNLDWLMQYRDKLSSLKDRAVTHRIPERNKLVVYWPKGYEG